MSSIQHLKKKKKSLEKELCDISVLLSYNIITLDAVLSCYK